MSSQYFIELQKQSPIRFAIEIPDGKFKIFSYFPIGNDGSIALHSYFQSTHHTNLRIDTPPEQLKAQDKDSISIGKLLKTAIPFSPHKISFHHSGYQNTKNKKGERPSDDSDPVSINFSEIQNAIRLCYIYPIYYAKYPKAEKKKNFQLLELKNKMITNPGMFEIRLSRTDFDLAKGLTEAYEFFVAYLDRFTLARFDLDIYTVFRRSNNPHFPKDGELIVTEKY